MSVLSSFPVTDDFEVSCFMRRPPEQGPWFAVREWDQKVIRRNALKEKPDKPSGRTINRSSEQAIRASIRQVILHMGLKSEAASREEVRMLKQHGIIGKRAPSCSLLNGEDMCRLLEAFGKDGAAQELREALERHAKAAGYTLPPPKPVPMQRRNFIDFMSKNDGLAFNPSKYRKVPPPRTRPVRERRPNLNLLSASDIDESEDEPSPDPSGISDNEDEPVSKPGKRICSVGKKPVAVESEEEEPQEIPAAGRRRKISSASAGKQDRRGSNGLEALLFAIGVDAQDPFDQTPAGFAASDSATVGNASNSRLGTPTASGTVPALAASAAASSSSSDRYIAPSRGVNPSPPIHNSAPSRPSTHNLSLSVPPSGVPVSSVHHPPLNFSFLPSPSHLSGLWPSSSPTASSHTRLESPIPLKPGCPSPAFSLKQENAGKTPELPGDSVSVLPFGTHQSNSHGQYTLHSPNTAVPPSLMSLYGNGYNHPSFLAPSPSGSFSPQSPSPLSPTPSLCSSAASINALLQNALGAPPSGLASPVPTNLGPANIRSFLTKYNAMFGDPDLASGKGSPPLPLGLYGSEPIAVGLHLKDSKETQ